GAAAGAEAGRAERRTGERGRGRVGEVRAHRVEQAADERLDEDHPDEDPDHSGELGADERTDDHADHAEQCGAHQVAEAPVGERPGADGEVVAAGGHEAEPDGERGDVPGQAEDGGGEGAGDGLGGEYPRAAGSGQVGERRRVVPELAAGERDAEHGGEDQAPHAAGDDRGLPGVPGQCGGTVECPRPGGLQGRPQQGEPDRRGQQAIGQPGARQLEQFDADKPGQRGGPRRERGGDGERGHRAVSLVSWKKASSRSLPLAVSSVTGPCATRRPWSMITTESMVCATSASMWLETSTVPPSAANPRSRPRSQRMPSGSRPLAGSSRISTSGSASSAVARPSRCRMPSENPPIRRPAASVSPTRSRTSSILDASTSAASAWIRRWARAVRPGWKLEASSTAPTWCSGSGSSR